MSSLGFLSSMFGLGSTQAAAEEPMTSEDEGSQDNDDEDNEEG